MANNGQWIEVQIRSERMNDIAEQGFAAHWKYKDGAAQEDISPTDDDTELNKWLVTIKEILDDPQPDAMDFLDTIKLNLFAQEIFVFTPKGEIKTLPQNSTVLDFGFSLHTEIGAHCIGAKVNHRLVPLSHKLNSGDQVEILTSRSQKVQPEWENIAATAKARAKIASILRKESKATQKKGLDTLGEFLKKEGIYVDEVVLDKLTRFHEKSDSDSLLEAIGSNQIDLGDEDIDVLRGKSKTSWRRFLKLPFVKEKSNGEATMQEEAKPPMEKKEVKKITKQILKLTEETIKKNYAIADCCHPIPGDDVLGYIDTNGKITIHKRQCPIASKLKSSYGNRIIATQWDTHKQLTFLVTIIIKGVDRLGLLNDVTQVISHQLNVNIRKLTIETVEGIFEGNIQLYVHDVEDVQAIIAQLKRIDSIQEVIRD
jgi:GTP pyrophosphokinase